MTKETLYDIWKYFIAVLFALLFLMLFFLLIYKYFTIFQLNEMEKIHDFLQREEEKINNLLSKKKNIIWNEYLKSEERSKQAILKEFEKKKFIILLPGGQGIEDNFFSACYFIDRGYLVDPEIIKTIKRINAASIIFNKVFNGGAENAFFLVADKETFKKLAEYDFKGIISKWHNYKHKEEPKYLLVNVDTRKVLMIKDLAGRNEELAKSLEKYWHPEWKRLQFRWECTWSYKY